MRAWPLTALFRLLPVATLVMLASCGWPAEPTVPRVSGPSSSQPTETLVFRAVSVDRNCDNISYRFDWGDGAEPQWSPELAAGETMRVRHTYVETGRFEIRVRARDETGLESGTSDPLAVNVAWRGPFVAGRPEGTAMAWPDTVLHFNVVAGHVRAESVSVQFDWGDTLGTWGPWSPAGVRVADSHAYRRVGSYPVRARARDRSGSISPWSDTVLLQIGEFPLEPPMNLRLSAVAGVFVRLRWDRGRNGDATCYQVWFRRLDTTGFVCVESTALGTATHDPLGWTGEYTVSARRGREQLLSAETVSTTPVRTDTVVLHELNAPGLAGYGWDRGGGVGAAQTMLDTAAASLVDGYFTDFGGGTQGPYYYFASPHLGPSDPGGVVPSGNWRRTRFLGIWGNNQDPLPEYDSLLYQHSVDVAPLRTDVSVYLIEGNYALLSLVRPDRATGSVRAVTWFQLVPGLRLIRHREAE